MSILVNNRTKVVVQGLTGSQGKYHAQKMKEYGTNIVAGVLVFVVGFCFHWLGGLQGGLCLHPALLWWRQGGKPGIVGPGFSGR